MCATTPADCITCGDTLTCRPGRRTQCDNGHTGTIDQLPTPAGSDIVTQYHAVGRSKVMIRTLCNHCRPL
jgi:hypothetical protein